ncbi:PDZ domain-containing protein [Deinococcus oregonensis]|uniref:Tricorn protease homolog n=1 Tax=Deinococcus oregonensis TaxID=1805970 RepID=A0ABV6B808_9DEIO
MSLPETLLLRQPALSAEHLAFVYAGDLWLADHRGSNVRRLTATPGHKQTPHFSPDGRFLAFSGNDDGAASVYVVPVEGGTPRRLTFHPGDDLVRGWTPRGEVLFASARQTISARVRRLYTLPLEGGHPAALPMPMAERGALSPEGRLAYTPFAEPFWSWKRYRGGMTVPIRLLDQDTLDEVEVPHENATDTFPCWLEGTLYFLSDRRGAVNVWQHGPGTGDVRQLTFHDDFDVRSLTAGAGRLAYEQGGRIHLLTPGEAPEPLQIRVSADLPNTRPRHVKAAPHVTSFGLSPTGARAVFAARGEIVTVPTGKGDPRTLMNLPGACGRDPAWSPDGQAVAYLSDAGGEYRLVVADQKGEPRRTYALGERPSFYYRPLWSPDGTRIAFTDKALHLSYLVLETGEVVQVDTDTYDHPLRSLDPAWSPDGQWLAYTRRLPNHLRAVFVHDVSRGESHQVSDGMSDAVSACFSRDGRLLYFAASVNYGLNTGWLDMSSYERPVTRSLYVAVLRRDDPSPLAPQSDEEPGPGPLDPAAPAEARLPEPVRIDLGGLGQRIVALPVPPGEYSRLETAENRLFYLERDPTAEANPEQAPERHVLRVWETGKRETREFLPGVSDYRVSANGKKLIAASGQPATYAVVDVAEPPKPEDGRLDLGQVEVRIEPRAEWAQIFEEGVRIHRDFFYDPGMHGLDWAAVASRYRAFLPHVGHREDLNFLLAELSGELVVGHAYVGGGDVPRGEDRRAGLLGADYEVAEGRYRFQRVLSGLNWNPDLRAPLTEPGVNVREGEYLLAVNGQPLRATDSVHALFEQTAERVTDLRVSPTPDEADARTVTVRPVGDERRLRLRAWIEENRRRVDELSGGRVAYVYMADTARAGYEAFNRYYFSQLDRQAVVLDERFNGGGSVADYVVDLLDRPLLSLWATREGRPFASPNASIFGPKAMVINELAGSGGDALPHFFRRRGLGPIVGKRTWGGLIGIYDYPPLIDGGMLTSPRLAIFSPEGEWEVENVGVAPDVEVELTTKLAAQGRDPQLERAVELVLAALEANPQPRVLRPAPDPRAVLERAAVEEPAPNVEP